MREARTTERIEAHLDPLVRLSASAAARIFGDYPCGRDDSVRVFCGSTPASAPGDYVFLANVMGDELPADDGTSHFQHGFVFDADGLAANNYEASAAYPGDFWQGTDLWFELSRTPVAGWSVKATDVRAGFAEVPTGARFVVQGRELAFLVPRAELDGSAPSYRVTSFWHEGDWGADGSPWSGDYVPDLDEPLFVVDDADPIVVDE